MPRTEEQNQQIRDERREQILQAALKVFARKGMAAAKISDIAAEAGLSHGLVYHYFKSKEEIFKGERMKRLPHRLLFTSPLSVSAASVSSTAISSNVPTFHVLSSMYELPESPFTQRNPALGFIGLPRFDETLSF